MKMHKNCTNKFLEKLEKTIEEKIKLVKEPNELLESKQDYNDKILQIYQEAFKNIIDYTITFSTVLGKIKDAYENSLKIRDERIVQFILQDISCHVGTNADGDPLWSARFLKTNPEDVYRTHLDYLRAGADVISTNTYQASVGGFVKHLGVATEEATELIRLAVELARRACDTYLEQNSQPLLNPTPLVAGSVGPYGAHLNDGSEYRGNYADKVSSETMREWHIPRINTLLEAGVDLLALETIPCLKEAQVLVELLKEYPKAKAWLSFSCKDDQKLAHGEDFQTAAVQCWQANPTQLIAVGVNCCPPNIVSNLVKGINEGRKQPIPFVTYPNSGERYIPDMGWTDKDKSESIDKFVHEWLKLGVRYIGGCCRTYQNDISQIRKLVDSWHL